jgi:hypothetical protein
MDEVCMLGLADKEERREAGEEQTEDGVSQYGVDG